ncbi:MAG: DMT family transporter [Candidatus Adiutrix sp.]|jgi:drug/metabolite transporter (DMT)-like permease|nr:DMT family transporter [Candidatus Adiutrix sp.]
MTEKTKCLLLLVVTAFLWSLGGVIIKSVTWHPVAIASGRSFWAALALIFLARKTVDLRPPDRTEWLGAFFMALLSLCFVGSTKLTTAANAILLQYTAPVWVALLAPLVLKEKTRKSDWFFIALTIGGLILFFLDSLSAKGLQGIGLACLNGLAFAGLVLTMRRSRSGQPLKIMIYGNFLLLATGLLFWRPPWPSAVDLALIAAAGVFQFALPYYLFCRASRGVSSLEMVLVTALEPILNPIWVFLAVGEKPGFWSLAGGAVVLVTVSVWSISKNHRSA